MYVLLHYDLHYTRIDESIAIEMIYKQTKNILHRDKELLEIRECRCGCEI